MRIVAAVIQRKDGQDVVAILKFHIVCQAMVARAAPFAVQHQAGSS